MLAKRKLKLQKISAKVIVSTVHLSILKQGEIKAIRFSTLDPFVWL
jgi:DNA-binding Xre family transcriptional regulator